MAFEQSIFLKEKEHFPMPETKAKNVKSAVRQIVNSLPDDATWDDVMYRIYIHQAIESGLRDVAEDRLVDVAEVRSRFGLPE